MRYPRFLNENGTIGICAPSYGCTTEPYRTTFANACRKLQEKGYTVIAGDNCYSDCGVGKSNTPQACAEELNQMYCDSRFDVLISCAGGELMCEDLDWIDFDAIKNAEPKWYMGYSDNTNFIHPLVTMCDTAAVYGPHAPAFGMNEWHPAILDTIELLRGQKTVITGYDRWERTSLKSAEEPLAPYNLTETTTLTIYPKGDVRMEGRLLGGCMDCLVTLVGTPYDKTMEFCEKYAEEGIIWFLECCDLNPMSMRRALWQMQHNGWFSHVKGFLIGRPYHYGETCCGLDQYDAITGILNEYGVPIIMDVPIGHLPPAMPLISGSYAEVSCQGNTMTITMKLI